MAAIIAQMTRANRERKKKRRYEISKCMYELPPFPDHFDKQLHNKYLRAKDDMKDRENAEKFHQEVIKRLQDIVEAEKTSQVFPVRTWISELLIIGLSLALVPSLVCMILLFWPETPYQE